MGSRFYFVFLALFGGPLMESCVSSFVPVPCCPAGWTRLGFRCFIFQNQQKTFSDSESSCQALGGHLASVHNEDEHLFIRQLILKGAGANTETWIGGNVYQSGRVWMWTDGSQFEYQAWGQWEPNNNGGNENCAEITSAGHWNDIPCASNFYFVCAKKL